MKKLFLALLAVASVGSASAQKNTILMYGNAGVSYGKTENGGGNVDKETMWNVTPGVGFQFNNHLTVGVQGGYNEFKNVHDILPAPTLTKTTARDREWQLGAFFRYTQPLGGIFFTYTQIDLSYIDGRNESESITPAGTSSIVASSFDTYNGFSGMITPAIGINVHHGFALNFSIGGLGYRMVSYDKAPTTLNSFYATMGKQVNFGITRNIGCHSHKVRGHHEPGMEHRKMKKHDADDDDE